MNTTEARQYIERIDTSAQHRSVPFTDGRTMRWRVFGSGDPLVLIHGGHGSWLHWIRNIVALSQRHSLLVPDLPGFGASDDLPEGSDILTIVDAVIRTLDSLVGPRSKIDVAGFSFGAVIAARIAVQRDAVRRLALMGSPGTRTPPRPRAQLVRWRSANEAAQDAALRHNMLVHMMYAEEHSDALAFLAYADAVKATRFRGRGSARSTPLRELLAPRTDPTLFLYGEHDVICTPELARDALVDGRAERGFQVIPDSGHWVQFEAADRINWELARCFGADAAIRSDTPTDQLI